MSIEMPNFLNGKSNGEAVKYDRLFWKIQPNPHFEIKSADSVKSIFIIKSKKLIITFEETAAELKYISKIFPVKIPVFGELFKKLSIILILKTFLIFPLILEIYKVLNACNVDLKMKLIINKTKILAFVLNIFDK